MNLKQEIALRKLIKEFIELEKYSKGLLDDDAFLSKSVFVPDHVKDKIKKWIKDMML